MHGGSSYDSYMEIKCKSKSKSKQKNEKRIKVIKIKSYLGNLVRTVTIK